MKANGVVGKFSGEFYGRFMFEKYIFSLMGNRMVLIVGVNDFNF